MDIFSKTSINFTYVLSSNYFPKINIENIPKDVALHLRRICDFDSKFEKYSAEYQKYLIARSYKPSKVKKQFSDVRNILTEETRRPKTKSNFSTSCNIVRHFKPMFPNIKTIF